ncbi:MAG TPA: hypothetical protein VNG51_10700 [Ktedonobacteraceae bacterium]|nr:hypothetical protein [Ktedonobacteraceae bacterium]
MRTTKYTDMTLLNKGQRQEPFARVAPMLASALLLGAGGGFVLASILTLTQAFSLPLGPWWPAIAQAHGHLQLYGWAGLFVLGVAFHFLPRLRGTPLAMPRLVPWLSGMLVTSLVLRVFCQPLLTVVDSTIGSVGLILSGAGECLALIGAVVLLGVTARRGPSLRLRPAFTSTLPLMVGAFGSLGIASIVNLVNMLQAATSAGLVASPGDTINVTLGLLGFLVPMALAMSARSLPMYAGLEGFPNRILRPLAAGYFVGLLLICIGILTTPAANWLQGVGMTLLGVALLFFIAVFLRLMRKRGRLPQKVAKLAPQPEAVAQSYKAQVSHERNAYGPFVALVASAYMWAMLGGVLLVSDGLALLLQGSPLFALDAMRHSLAVGFIALLICGIAPRMIPGFSGGSIASPRLVTATLWLGNCAAVLRVGSLLVEPLLATYGNVGQTIDVVAFGLSGPIGLALAICLAVNLWPALKLRRI